MATGPQQQVTPEAIAETAAVINGCAGDASGWYGTAKAQIANLFQFTTWNGPAASAAEPLIVDWLNEFNIIVENLYKIGSVLGGNANQYQDAEAARTRMVSGIQTGLRGH
jgi:WXG100 family type VII secretion target